MITAIGNYTLNTLKGIVAVLRIFLASTVGIFEQVILFRFRFSETIAQMYAIGVESLPVIAFALTFVSLMMVLEFSFHMKLVLRQDSLVPAFSTVLMLRELGPVVTCLLLTSRAGAGIAAELGSMKVTEQIDALRLLSIDPIEFLTIPRWIACVFACVSLSVISIAIAILGGASIATASLGYPLGQYFNTMFVFARFHDLETCVIKAVVFGTIIPIVSSYHGLHCKRGSDGVGNAATNAVVQSSLLIIAADFILTYLLYAA